VPIKQNKSKFSKREQMYLKQNSNNYGVHRIEQFDYLPLPEISEACLCNISGVCVLIARLPASQLDCNSVSFILRQVGILYTEQEHVFPFGLSIRFIGEKRARICMTF
jgi:hypothetical protein